MNSSSTAIILAAGKGTRMKSELPKVLVPVAGRPMIDYVLDALEAAGVGRIIVVVGYRAELVREALATRRLTFVEQTQQLGTGHAVAVCRDQLEGLSGPVLVVAGDSPMIQAESISKLLQDFLQQPTACLLGTAYKDNPQGLGRIVRDNSDGFLRIVEEKDASPAERQIREVNMSTYVFDNDELLWALAGLSNRNAQGEYYLTDCPGILRAAGKPVRALPVLQPVESLSINTVEELVAVEAEMQRRWLG